AEKRIVGLASYIVLGWVAVIAMPELARRLGGGDLSLLIVGGALYTVGAVVLGTRWPDPSPRFFGYHEVWHTMVTAAVVCHFVEVVLAAKAAGLPVLLGMEVDHYAGRMDRVADVLRGYPFDVLLGSVHWIGGWGFDILGDPVVDAEWDARSIESVWDGYTRC